MKRIFLEINMTTTDNTFGTNGFDLTLPNGVQNSLFSSFTSIQFVDTSKLNSSSFYSSLDEKVSKAIAQIKQLNADYQAFTEKQSALQPI
jgi:hypothetical protein